MNKTCTKCKRKLPLSAFGKHRLCKDGLNPECKECNNSRTKVFSKSPSGIYTQIKSRLKFRKTHLKRRGILKKILISRKDFVRWYENAPKICIYCNIPEEKLFQWNDSHNNKVCRLTVDCMDNELGYVEGNLVLSCLRCNGIKSDIFDHETMAKIGQTYIYPIWIKAVTMEK